MGKLKKINKLEMMRTQDSSNSFLCLPDSWEECPPGFTKNTPSLFVILVPRLLLGFMGKDEASSRISGNVKIDRVVREDSVGEALVTEEYQSARAAELEINGRHVMVFSGSGEEFFSGILRGDGIFLNNQFLEFEAHSPHGDGVFLRFRIRFRFSSCARCPGLEK